MTEPRPKRPRGRKSGCVILLVLCGLALFILIDHDWTGPGKPPPPETLEYDGHTWQVTPVEFLRSKGLDAKDIPPEENAALDYLIAHEMLPPSPDDFDRAARERLSLEEKYVLAYDWSNDCSLLWSWHQAAESAFARARVGLDKASFQSPLLMQDHDLLTGMATPGVRPYLRLGWWFVRLGKKAEASGHHAEACDRYLAVVMMGNHSGQDPHLVGSLLGMTLNTMGFDGLERWILSDPPPAMLREALARARALALGRPGFHRTSRSNQVLFLDYLTVIGTEPGGESTFAERIGAFLKASRTVRWIIRARSVSLFRKLDDWYALGAPARYAALTRIRSEIQRSSRSWACADSAPWCSRVPSDACRFAVNDLQWAAVQVRLGLALYRAEHGRYPKALEEIRPYLGEIPVDPFTEKPLHYRPEGEQYVFYSVGADLKDNGGVDTRKDKTRLYAQGEDGRSWHQQDDLVFSSKLAPPPSFDEYLENNGHRRKQGWSTEQPGASGQPEAPIPGE
ncbi:MAG: hypothetical protein JW889_14650 [Verrucomicrobia bacterium]|nr:hypothetical protein [Verrucomicrobiota bacterium]